VIAADFPLPGSARATVVAAAPAPDEGSWAGAPSAILDAVEGFVVAYRTRTAIGRGGQTIVARSAEGERFETVAVIDKSRFDAESMERPAIVRTADGRWRLYVCCATKNSKHWWISMLEADDLAGLASAPDRVVFPGDASVGVKDPIVQRTADGWLAWICCHPLDVPDEEDRMTTAFATSRDGIDWQWHGTVMRGRPEMWDARGARLTVVLPDGRAAYDGRRNKEENWFERTGLARRQDDGRIEQFGDDAVADVRYLDVVALPQGGYRIFYEARLPDLSHELRTELIVA
jgi:hypothetical protein